LGSARIIHLNVENSDCDTGTMAADEPNRRQHTPEVTQIAPEQRVVLDECPSPVPHVELKTTTKEGDETCENSDRKKVLSPLKVVVERIEDFTVNKTFSALEITPPLHMECKEVPSCEVSGRSRRKIKSPVKRTSGDPKLPPFKGRSKRVRVAKTPKHHTEVSLLSDSCGKKKVSEKPKALKCPNQVHSGIKHGGERVVDLTGQEDITGPETTSRNNPSPSLLPAASGRTSSKTKQIKPTNGISEVDGNDVTMPQDVKLLKLSTTGTQPEQLLNSDILNDANKNKHSNSKCHINNSADSRQVRNDNLSPLCDKKQICDVESSKQNVASSPGQSNTSVRKVNEDTHCNGSSGPANNGVADGEVKELSMPNSAELIPCVEMQETNKKYIKPSSRRRSAKKEEEDVKMVDQNTLCKADMLKTDSDAERKDVKFSEQNISNSNDGFPKSLRELLVAKTGISQIEATLPCVQTQNINTSPHEVHKCSKKAADSEDVIESSQDSSSSLLNASKLIQKCSVSVCRIDTTLGPGATISVPHGGCRHIVLTPERSSSSFKVYEDKPASTKQRKSAEALSGLGKGRHRTRHAGNRSLNGKYADVTEMDSVKDKPSMSLGINFSRGKSTEHSAPECCVSGEVNRSRSEDGIATAGKEDTPKPQTMEEIDASVSKDNILVVSMEETLKQRADKKFNASESEDCVILPCFKEDGIQPHSSQEINMSESADSVIKKEKENIREPWSKQQLSTTDANDNHLSSLKEVAQECHSKQHINKSALEDTQLTAVGENVSKLKRKRPFNASNCDGRVLTLLKEDIPRPGLEQQRSETCGLTAAKEGRLKPRASKCEVSSLAEGLKARFKHDSTVTAVIPKSEPEQQSTMLKPENKNTTVKKEGAEKSELNSSNCEDITMVCITDDTAELRPKHTGVRKRTKNNSRVNNHTGRQGAKLVLRSSSGGMLTKDEFMKDRPQQVVTPEAVSTNQCQRNSDKQTKDENVSKVGHNISSPLNRQKISDNSVADSTTGAKKTPLNESNILDVNFKVPFPLQSRKRRASHDVPRRQTATTLDSLADTGASKIKKLAMQNSEDGRLYAKSVCDRSVSAPSEVKLCDTVSSDAPSEVKLCDTVSSDTDKTLSPPSSNSLVTSPSVLLQVFSSVLGRTRSSESHKSHYKYVRGGRARILLDRAGAVKQMGTWSNVQPEEVINLSSSGTQSLPRVHLCSMSVGGSSPLGT
jgi:3-methyladenine DNA glycosylase AlkC